MLVIYANTDRMARYIYIYCIYQCWFNSGSYMLHLRTYWLYRHLLCTSYTNTAYAPALHQSYSSWILVTCYHYLHWQLNIFIAACVSSRPLMTPVWCNNLSVSCLDGLFKEKEDFISSAEVNAVWAPMHVPHINSSLTLRFLEGQTFSSSILSTIDIMIIS